MKNSKIVKELDKKLDRLDEIIASIGVEFIGNSTLKKEIFIIPRDEYLELLDLYDDLDDLKDRLDFNS
nr:MAG TPA: hypothetical protein [Caudoviricetes sp.]